jgi:hypothetical protein
MISPIAVPDSGCSFNYTAFWNHALQKAFSSNSTRENKTSCPKVFVYDLPKELTDNDDVDRPFSKTVFGTQSQKCTKASMYTTKQFAFPSILEYRLRHSKCRTHDANEADLFFVPYLTAPKSHKEWEKTCQKQDSIELLLKSLTHLNDATACKHFFAMGKGHYVGETCTGWFSHPLPPLKQAIRLAYSHLDFKINETTGEHTAIDTAFTQQMYPNLVSVPYPSSVHLTNDAEIETLPQFSSSRKHRHVLMSLVGRENHGDHVRKNIVESCKHYGDTVCRHVKGTSDCKVLQQEKSSSMFCLEPAGDSPWRKGISDSITLGCIPVLFADMTDDVAPWHWGDWKDKARVLIPREPFVRGCIDLKKLLQSAPAQLVQVMQETLRTNARKFQYSIDDDPNDGIRVILDGLHRHAMTNCPRV